MRPFLLGSLSDSGKLDFSKLKTNPHSEKTAFSSLQAGKKSGALPSAVADDYRDGLSDTTAPTGQISINGSVAGSIETSGDRDIFAITLTAGQSYTFDLTKNVTGGLADPFLRVLNGSGTVIASNDDFGGSLNSQVTITASASGTYYVQAGGYGSAAGGYRLSAKGKPPADDYRDSLTDTTAPLGTIVSGTSKTGKIEVSGDKDIFSLSVTAGQTYTFNLDTAGTGGLADPFLRVLNGSGTQLAANDDFGGTNNSQISFTATSTGTVYLEAGGYGSSTGNYSLKVSGATPPPADDFRDSVTDTTAPFGTVTVGAASAGLVETGGDKDVFSVSLTAGQTYTFNLNSVASGGLANPSLKLLNGSGTVLASNDDFGGSLNSQISFTATASGTYYLEAGGSGATQVGAYSLAAAAASPPSGGFDIVFRYTGDPAYQSAFNQAAAIWEEAIIGDLPDFVSNRYGAIDDLLIDASVIAIDGAGGVLGRAGPDEFRSGSQLPTHGVMEFDSADLASMQANGTLVGVILHEMGHVLGLGTLWSNLGLKSGSFNYIGANALAEYRILSGNPNASSIPLETTGGQGTAGSHWSESVFGTELMTGYANGSLPMSRMTIGALADLGYRVDYAAADPYSLPGASLQAAGVAPLQPDHFGLI